MALCLLPTELILYLGKFLSNSSLNALMRTQKWFAQLLTPQLYGYQISFREPQEDFAELDPYDLPLLWFHCVGRWHSDIILSYFRTSLLRTFTYTDKFGHTLLHIVAGTANTELAQILVRKGLNINAKTLNGRTPLFEAVRSKQREMMDYLLDTGADVMATETNGHTLLEETALFGSGSMVQRLVDALQQKQKLEDQYVNHEAVSQSSRDKALHRAIYNGDSVSVRILLDYGANPSSADGYGTTALASSAIHRRENVIYMLLDRGADPLPYDTLGRSAITCAADSRCSWDVVQTLFQAVLNAGGDITAEPWPGNEYIPLHCFAKRGYLPAVKFLLSHKANALARTQSGVTALQLALFCYSEDPSSYEEVCRLLIEAINAANDEYDHTLPPLEPLTGGTSLHLAVRTGSETLVHTLLYSGVDVSAVDGEGRSALDVARLEGHDVIVKLLSEKVSLN
ncbi:hypothetical protein PISL3812_07023 [Talaromyces islandicus]|uniref:Uncharacterized protein n=1 Tax=Talaromyces islandicus TaxID=28573 RepID=A0A0U1M304_TALIS|nr:hypothetical protein PISL3812_07023 [Talaromyces islandicus]